MKIVLSTRWRNYGRDKKEREDIPSEDAKESLKEATKTEISTVKTGTSGSAAETEDASGDYSTEGDYTEGLHNFCEIYISEN